jgi:hypothetical protein
LGGDREEEEVEEEAEDADADDAEEEEEEEDPVGETKEAARVKSLEGATEEAKNGSALLDRGEVRRPPEAKLR